MKKISRILTITIFSFCLFSCENFKAFTPKTNFSDLGTIENSAKLDIKNFFNGDLEGFAITQDQDGKIIGSNLVKIHGKWEENKGVIKYDFVYNGGRKDSRTWLITLDADNTFSAVGHDVSSPVKGRQIGNAAQMIYSLSLPSNGVKQDVKFEDKMYLVDEKSMIVISTFKKNFSSTNKSIISLKKVN